MTTLIVVYTLITLCAIWYLTYLSYRSRRQANHYRSLLCKEQGETQQARNEADLLKASNNEIIKASTELCQEAARVQEIWEGASAHLAGQTALLVMVNGARETWKSYALALEVLCECCADGDDAGAENARLVIQEQREILRMLGEYDD